ncbi:MAG: hypothetical protein J0I07_41475 [Myxococcales bacterium]|nr:hypothetical protein [Myxococcales bacterium]
MRGMLPRFSRNNRTSPFAVAVAIGSLMLLSGCSPSRGTVTPAGYHQTLYGFEVRSEGGSFLGPDWLLDSHDKLGAPKREGIYKTQFNIDADNDGSYSHREEQLTYDLRFRHRYTNAILWLTTFPVSSRLAETKLSVEMRELVDNMAGGRFETAKIGQTTTVEDTRFATRIISEGPATLAGHDAYWATVDVANVDQLKLDASHRQQRMRLVLVRTPFKHRVRFMVDLPVYMVVGYASAPSEFDAEAPAVKHLLDLLVIQGKQGFVSAPAHEVRAAAPVPSATTSADPSATATQVPSATTTPIPSAVGAPVPLATTSPVPSATARPVVPAPSGL